MFEERKWKKGISCVISNQISSKVKKTNRKKKLDELYKRCMCLYISMNINNNLADISMGKENKNMSEQLNSYIKSISNVDYFNKQFAHWKIVLGEIKNKIQKKFGEKNLGKAKNFFKVIGLMENMITMQEETVRKINEINERNRQRERGMMIDDRNNKAAGIFNFISDIDEMNYNDKLRQDADHHLYTEYFEKNFHNLDLNLLSRELNEVIEEIVTEFSDEGEIFLNSSMMNDTNSNNNSLIISVGLGGGNNSINIPHGINLNNQNFERANKIEDIILSLNINPKQLFYDSHNLSNSKNTDELKSYLEKTLKVENEKIETLPSYNYQNMAGAIIDVNKKIINFTDEFNKFYLQFFPTIYFSDNNNYDKIIIESEIEYYKTKYDRIPKEPELVKLYRLKFDNFTTLQKLILMWGLVNYGTNMNLLCEIPNIFPFTKSLPYESDEIFVNLERICEQFNVDLIASNFETANLMSYNKSKSTRFHHIPSSDYIYNLDPPMLNSSQCNFYYNKKMYDFVNYAAKSINNSDITFCYPTQSKMKNIIYSIPTTRLNLIHFNPILKKVDEKKYIFSNLKDDIKKVCDRVENLYNYNQKSLLNYNFQTFTKTSTDNQPKNNRKNSDYNMTIQPVNINRNNLLSQLINSKYDFSSMKSSEIALENTKPNTRQDTLEGVSFYSQQSIQKEWEILRSPWYQNNTQFKPKFRKPYKPMNQQNTLPQNFQNPPIPGINILKNLNDNRN